MYQMWPEEGSDQKEVWTCGPGSPSSQPPFPRMGCSTSPYPSVQPPELQKRVLTSSYVCLCVEQPQLQAPPGVFQGR